MAVKDSILEILEKNRGIYISGEDLAGQLSVSRAAVWKAMKKLSEEGFPIDAISNKGYCLQEETDMLSENGIRKYLEHHIEMDVYKTITSTNLVMKERVSKPEGYTIVSASQTGGMGRLGRNFSSPVDTGVYFSILLKPKLDSKDMTMLTVIAAVAVCEAVEKYTRQEPKIKWVNDVFLNGKKVTGILTQASFSVEDLSPEYAIVGIGINVYEPEGGFEEELKNIAGALLTERKYDMKNKLVAGVLNRYFYYYERFTKDNDRSFVDEYKKRCFVMGKQIRVISRNESRLAIAKSLDDECHLLVCYEDGTKEALSTGEISIRVNE